MAKYEVSFNGDMETIAQRMHEGILGGSISASFEDESYFESGNVRCLVRVYERYSFTGGNRLSCTLTIFSDGKTVLLSAITSGGSQAMFMKINTFGEDSFLDEVIRVARSL